MRTTIKNFANRSAALAIAAVMVWGCSDQTAHMDQASAALAEYYAAHPFERDWQVTTIAILESDNKLMVRVEINSESDVARLRTLSSMEQFAVAKLACPLVTPELRDALGDTRVWIVLTTSDKQITTSICPQ